MSGKKIGAIAALATFGFAIIFASGVYSFFNTSTTLISAYEAKIDANKADFDNMWKVIQEVASVPDQHKNAFKEVMTSYAEARAGQTGDGTGSFLSIMKEAVPDFTGSADLFSKIQTVVEAQRGKWTIHQKELRDLKRTHDTLVRTMPGLLYNSFIGHDELEAIVITSTRTEQTFQTGKDDNVGLFNKPEPG